MKDANQKWKEIFVLNDLSFETLNEDIPVTIIKNVLKYPDQVREFLDNGYWWENTFDGDCSRPGKSFEFGSDIDAYFDPLVEDFMEFYEAEDIIPIEVYGNCFNGNMNLHTVRSALPHVDTFPGDDQNEDPLNDVAFNMSLTKSDKVKTSFYSFNDKKSVCDFTAKDYNDLRDISNKHEYVTEKQWKESGENEYENYKLEYVADIDYNSMILYPSHYWHNAYLKEDWFVDEDRVTFTGFFELIK